MTPVLFFAQILVILALALLAGAVIAGPRPGRLQAGWPARLTRMLDGEKDRAAALGWRVQTWVGVRIGAGIGGTVLGLVIGTPVVVAGGFALGFFGLPWFLGDLAAKRKLQMERALINVARNVVELITASNQTLDHALSDIATNPEPVLAEVLRPLARTEESIRARLVEVALRARSPIASRLCVDLLLALESTPAAFVEEASEVLIPQLEDDLKLQERNYGGGGRQPHQRPHREWPHAAHVSGRHAR